MLFNSYIFILAFLPATLIIYNVVRRLAGAESSFVFLALASLLFYAYWKPSYLFILLASVLFNYLAGLIIQKSENRARRKWILTFSIAINLALLGYYKYAGFFVTNVEALVDRDLVHLSIVLPLAISFFTFQQIAYLVDVYKGYAKEYRFVHYCLFIVFFPQLIAGPIVHHKEILPQFVSEKAGHFDLPMFRAGVFQFIIGLTKKVLIADSVALYASPVFSAADGGLPLTATEAWIGLLAYTFQIYFDFSGYSDMALGIGKMFGIKLPDNFNSPYKATSIADFWRRWHMTLSRFLRDYLYVPLGGNRKGKVRRYVNLSITMLLGGLWHGASWNFVLWGGLHGFYLVVNHAWRSICKKLNLTKVASSKLFAALAWMTTFAAVVAAWVPFRAETVHGAHTIYFAMVNMNGAAWQQLTGAIGSDQIGNVHRALTLLTGCFLVSTLFPNSQQWEAMFEGAAIRTLSGKAVNALNAGLSGSLALMFVMCLSSMNKVSEFLYYQF